MINAKKVSKTALAALIVASMSTACTTFDPYTGEERTSRAVKYGAIGAVVCGIIGSTKDSKHARNAALGCGAIGAGIGAYMDHQEKELREELAGTGVGVERDGDQIHLIMPGNITFETDQYDIRGDFFPVLDSVSKVLYKYTDTNLKVAGFTDSVGSDAYNQELSEKRAVSVANYLQRQNIASQRVNAVGYGERYPASSNETSSGRQQNRRVELTITAVEK